MSEVMGSGRLSGKVALITGGAGAIGATITRRYLEEGATVVVVGRDAAKLQQQREALLAEHGIEPSRIYNLAVDGSDSAAVRSAVAEVMERYGRIDILVNNAGSEAARQRLVDIPLRREDLRDGDSETLLEGIQNVLGIAWNFIRATAPVLKPGASIINISTIFSRTAYYGRVGYAVPKAALNALTKAAARELGPKGVRVNLVYPGPIEGERIRNAFRRMDALQGLPEHTTAETFLGLMRLSRPDAEGQLTKGFPSTLDVANACVFLGSDEAAALSGEALEVTNGMDVPEESRTTFTARPSLRAVDGSGRVILVYAGDQIEDAMALTGALRSCGAEVVLGFRSHATIAQLEQILEESRRFAGANYTPPVALYLNPNEPESVTTALRWMHENTGGPHCAVILPASGVTRATSVSAASDEAVAAFLEEELAGAVTLASRLARHWQNVVVAPGAPVYPPRVIFLSNGDDKAGNVLGDVLRAGIEELVRIWRHEAEIDAKQAAPATAAQRLPPVWANQLVRYVNSEDESLEFACAMAAQLLLSDRKISEINLYLPDHIVAATGARRPSFGWAESLIGLHLGKVALITGGSAGIGGQIGRLLALSGARVMLAARDRAKLEQMRKSIVHELEEVGYNDAPSRVQIYPGGDVADEAQLAALVERTIAVFGQVDYLINNAGIAGEEEMVLDMPIEGWRHTLKANLISNYSLIRKLAPLMKKQGSGYILNVSSYFGGEKYAAIAYPNRADYAVSKAGQRAMAEVMARFLGPEVQINALAPGPVEGDRLRGTGERPGLFMRRARLILENRRINDIYAALIETHRESGLPIAELLPYLASNRVRDLENPGVPARLRALAQTIAKESDPSASSSTYLMNRNIAEKLMTRLRTGGYIGVEHARLATVGAGGESRSGSPTNVAEGPSLLETVFNGATPPEPFFARAQIEREARKVRDGIMSMLYLQRMPSEFDVAMATVYYLADRNVSGETFHPSGGLRYERTPTGGELFGHPPADRLARLAGATAYLIGEHMEEHLELLARAYLERHNVRQVVLISETQAGGERLTARLSDHVSAGRVGLIVAGSDLEGAFDRAIAEYGRPGPIVCTPFRALPSVPLVGRTDSDWSTVLSEEGFAELCEQQLTHHFRIARKASLVDGAALVLVTPETTATSSTEQFALANFVKTTLHAFTATIGVESERTIHRILVNQVDLTRQARAEEPRTERERQQELERFVDAVLLTTAPISPDEDTRYAGRIYRGRAITV